MAWLTPTWSLAPATMVFVGATVAIALAGRRLVGVVDRLADRTGMGEALGGALLLAGATSLAGLVVSIVAATDGDASLAMSNSMGGIAAQTAFVVVADLAYRQANIEHAAASLANLLMGFVLVALLAVVLMGVATPDWTAFSVHPASGVLAVAYLYGLHLSRSVGAEPMWEPRETAETRLDVPAPPRPGPGVAELAGRFAVLAAVVAVAGWAVGRAGVSIAAATGLDGTVVGAFVTSIASSTPELFTTLAAVRSGALTLAIGGIVGGNAFDVLFVAAGDAAYREGSIYAAADSGDVFVVAWTILLVAVLGAGLLRRERTGIGFEGVGILALYGLGAVIVVAMG